MIKGEQMIKFEITLPHNDGMTDKDMEELMSFMHSLDFNNLEFLLEGNIIKQMRPIKITIKRSKLGK